MVGFENIEKSARARRGAVLSGYLVTPVPSAQLAELPDHRYLSLMSLRIFRAGLKHSMVDAKWPAFEDVFDGFDVRRVSEMGDVDMARLLSDRRLIRHKRKLAAVLLNATAMRQVAAEHGSFARWFADWPLDDITGLWDALQKRFKQLGGNSGPRVLRMAGKDTFLLTPDVKRALVHWGALAEEPKGKRGNRAAQVVFNQWFAETGLPLCQLSQLAACSLN